MQDLEYLIQILKFCVELPKVVPGGVVGASHRLLCIEMCKNDTISAHACLLLL